MKILRVIMVVMLIFGFLLVTLGEEEEITAFKVREMLSGITSITNGVKIQSTGINIIDRILNIPLIRGITGIVQIFAGVIGFISFTFGMLIGIV